MTDVIHLLPDHVANQIAAGEVVQRPASVIKELLENAIDAGATEIKVHVKEAGKTLIQVTDNGKGMSISDARNCFSRHATSKIRSATDLFNLNTKGFRGEALASIAAIAQVELKTRRAVDEIGTCVRIEGSEIRSQDACVTPEGTSLSVKNLFYNIPARRNFLKSDTVELRHIINEFHRVCLAHPDIQFALFHNNSELFQLPGTHTRPRIVSIFGGKTHEKLVPVEEDTEIVRVRGFVGKPEFARKSRGEQFFFVNDRFIQSHYLNHAVVAAFEGLLKDKSHPSYFLYLEVPPESIDINIHPTKTEVKFDDEHSLYIILRSAIKHSLGQFNVTPVLDFERDATLDTPYEFKTKGINPPKVEVDPNYNPFKEESKFNAGSGGKARNQNINSWEGLYTAVREEESLPQFEEQVFESDGVTGNLFGEDTGKDTGNATIQLHRKYIVSTLRSGLLVIDQHRAQTRILYEELLKNITVSAASSQQLLFPLVLRFSTREMSMLSELRESLEQTGFVFSVMERDLVAITGIPALISDSEAGILLEQLLSDLENEVPGNSFSQIDLLAKSLARGMAVKPGTPLNPEEQQSILNRLFACKESMLSPFNKPIFITLTVDELDKKFL